MVIARLAALVAVTAGLVQCAPDPGPPATPSPATPTAAEPAPETFRTVPRPPPLPPPPTAGPAVISSVTAADLGSTWQPGCPLPPERLRQVELDYRGFDGQTHRGQLVVHEDLTGEVIDVFAELYRIGYPIERMRTVENYPDADDELSMRDNNTSAFNCRDIPGTGQWSYHAYGRAIDVNPRLNPFVDRRGDYQPANAAPWVDRTRTEPGMLHDGDAAVLAFTDRGWTWGGHWRTPLDYQHFELP